jgi:hypothetical protein
VGWETIPLLFLGAGATHCSVLSIPWPTFLPLVLAGFLTAANTQKGQQCFLLPFLVWPADIGERALRLDYRELRLPGLLEFGLPISERGH